MRCIGCGEEMHVVQAVADHTMMVPGYEHQTLACPGCEVVERRLVFARPIGPLAIEPMRLPPGAPASTTAQRQNERIDVSRTWTRAIERLRSQQSALKERAAAARTSKTVRRFFQAWDGFMPRRRGGLADRSPPRLPSDLLREWASGSPQKARQHEGSERVSDSGAAKAAPANPPTSAQKPTQSRPTKVASGNKEAQPGAAPTGALARVVAKLRSRQATINAGGVVKEHSLEGQPFDQLWENLGPSARRPTPAAKPPTPRPRPLARLRSLVPIEARPGEPSSPWARAVAMLQGRQDRSL
jgi:hypothetical protein